MTSTKPMKHARVQCPWWVDSWGWVCIRPGVILTKEEIEEITRQVHECRPGKPN